MNLKGFPHSDIPGSKLVCSSPGLIAAYRVLHRLLAPRHSPYALSSLTTSVSNSRDCELCDSQQRQLDLFSHCVLPGTPEAARDRNREPPQGGLPDSVFEKNYRLQDIQLSKNRRRTCAPQRDKAAIARGARQTWWRIPGSNR
jgi:hypothetical protein